MNLRDLVEVAALTSRQSKHLIQHSSSLSDEHVREFSGIQRSLIRGWMKDFRTFRNEILTESPVRRQELWKQLQCSIETLMVSEILTRVWSAILAASDMHQRQYRFTRLARQMMHSHLAARNVALQLMVAEEFQHVGDWSVLDRSRRKIERWTDLLLGHLVNRFPLDEYTFNPDRARDFGSEQLMAQGEPVCDRAWDLLLAGLRLAFPIQASLELSLGCQELLENVLSSFPVQAFKNTGSFKQPRQQSGSAHPLQKPLSRKLSDRAPQSSHRPHSLPKPGPDFRGLRPFSLRSPDDLQNT